MFSRKKKETPMSNAKDRFPGVDAPDRKVPRFDEALRTAPDCPLPPIEEFRRDDSDSKPSAEIDHAAESFDPFFSGLAGLLDSLLTDAILKPPSEVTTVHDGDTIVTLLSAATALLEGDSDNRIVQARNLIKLVLDDITPKAPVPQDPFFRRYPA